MKTTSEHLEKGFTSNEFQYLNMDHMDKCFIYYQEYANSLISALHPTYNSFNKKKEKSLSFDYFWSADINARSLEESTKDYIELNERTILKLYAFFHKLNTRKNTIKTTIPLEPNTEILCSITLNNSYKSLKPITEALSLSDDISRNNLAEYMAMFAIKFIIAHEIGHIYNGHTKYYLEILNQINLTKTEPKNSETDKLYLDLQTLEMDADAYAINRVIDDVMNLINTKDKIFDIIETEKDIFKILKYSIHGLFYIFRDDDIVNYKSKIHPPTFVREALIWDSMIQALEKNHQYEITSAEVLTDITEIERIICQVDMKSNAMFIQYIKRFTNEAATYTKEINDNWKSKICYLIKPESRLPIERIDY